MMTKIRKLPAKADTVSISRPRIGASCGERANNMHIVPITYKREKEET